MKKASTVRRPKFADEKWLGSEPTITEESSQSDVIRAYNWFNYFYNSEDAKSFTLSYLKSIKYDKEIIRKLSKAKAIDLHNIGWNCRLLTGGSTLPDGVWDSIEQRITSIASATKESDEMDTVVPVRTISVQERLANKTSDLIGELEEQLDVFFQEGVIQFDVKKWSLEKGIKSQIAKRINEHFYPQYTEITEALKGKDKELVEAYRGWRKPILKIMALFIKKICDHMAELEAANITIRKPRKKKIKPAFELVSKLNYCKSSDTLTSIDPKEIIGASQLWVFNVKTRNLSVYHAVDRSGLSVGGTTLTGFNPASSITKKLRKPEEQIQQLIKAGKVDLRHFMNALSTKEAKATGRINAETILLRVLK